MVRERCIAVLRLRCPRCRQGRVFEGWLRMREACPLCAYRFEKEPGYFVGAMYISYALAVGVYLLLAAGIHVLWPACPPERVLGAALIPLVALSPVLFRYSRVVWLHLDWLIHPAS